MRKFARVLFIGAALAAAPAAAQTNTDMCGQAAESYTPQQVVNACTALINGGGYGNDDLAIIYSNRGNAFKRAGDLRSALADQDTAIQYNPGDGITYYNRGNVRRQAGDNAGALADYDIGVRYAPNHQPIWYQRGLVHYERGEYQQSIADSSEAIRLAPNHADSYTNRANAYIMVEQFGQAIADLNVAIGLQPSVALHRYNRGVANERAGSTQAAIADYTETLRLDPRYANALGNRGNLKAANGDVPGGIADLTAALTIRENVTDLHNRGHVYANQRDYMRALADFDRAAQIEPNSHGYDNDRCWYRVMANTQLDVARAACDRGALAYANIPADLANVLDSRGLLNLKQNRFQDAWDDYSAAMRANSSGSSYPFGRGVAALRLGRTEDARADFARAIALDAGVVQRYADYGFPIDAALLPTSSPSTAAPLRPTPVSAIQQAASPPPQIVASAPPPPPPPAATAPAPTQAAFVVPPGRHSYVFQCRASNQELRVTLDGDEGTALIVRIRRPSVTLRAQPGDASGFRYTNDDYELRGNYAEVYLRTGSSDPVRCRRG